jgi:uridine kinase
MVDVLIVEGDMLGEQGRTPRDLYNKHVYNPQSLYIHVPDEERLRRRVERDMQQRNGQGETPLDVIESFEHRQTTQHVPYTLGYAAAANAIIMPAHEQPNNGPHTYDMFTF